MAITKDMFESGTAANKLPSVVHSQTSLKKKYKVRVVYEREMTLPELFNPEELEFAVPENPTPEQVEEAIMDCLSYEFYDGVKVPHDYSQEQLFKEWLWDGVMYDQTPESFEVL